MGGLARTWVAQDDHPAPLALGTLAKSLGQGDFQGRVAFSQLSFCLGCIRKAIPSYATEVNDGVQGNVDILDVDIHFELFDETRNRKCGVLRIGFLAVLLNLFFKVFTIQSALINCA
jgi:hypothetical protein